MTSLDYSHALGTSRPANIGADGTALEMIRAKKKPAEAGLSLMRANP
jgi:hypothetical protein